MRKMAPGVGAPPRLPTTRGTTTTTCTCTPISPTGPPPPRPATGIVELPDQWQRLRRHLPVCRPREQHQRDSRSGVLLHHRRITRKEPAMRNASNLVVRATRRSTAPTKSIGGDSSPLDAYRSSIAVASASMTRSAAFRFTCGARPPCLWQTVAPRTGGSRHRSPWRGPFRTVPTQRGFPGRPSSSRFTGQRLLADRRAKPARIGQRVSLRPHSGSMSATCQERMRSSMASG
jgi:hypothetical protein